MNSRLHNTAFALIVGAVLGVTLWSVYLREPAIMKIPLKTYDQGNLSFPRMRESSENTGSPIKALGDDKQVPKIKGKTEMMIERGELSNHPAMYYRKVDK